MRRRRPAAHSPRALDVGVSAPSVCEQRRIVAGAGAPTAPCWSCRRQRRRRPAPHSPRALEPCGVQTERVCEHGNTALPGTVVETERVCEHGNMPGRGADASTAAATAEDRDKAAEPVNECIFRSSNLTRKRACLSCQEAKEVCRRQLDDVDREWCYNGDTASRPAWPARPANLGPVA